MLNLYHSTNTPIAECDFSVRAYTLLMRAGVDTVEKLTELSVRDLMSIRNMGKRVIAEILTWLAQSIVYTEAEQEATKEEPSPFVLILLKKE